MSLSRLHALSVLKISIIVACAAIGLFLVNNQAQAANTVSAAVYQDVDGNGTVDRIRWTMDENVTACAYEAGDWTINTAGTINVTAITGISCTGSDAILNIAVTASSNITGGGTNPVISYANAGTTGSVTLTSGAMTAKNSQANTDGAAPVIVSTSPVNNGSGTLLTANIVLTFSEAMDPSFDEATEFTVAPDPGTFTDTWSVSDTVVTLALTDLNCGLAYTFTTVEAQVAAAAGSPTTLVTTGPQDGDWTFFATECGDDETLPASVSSFTYLGPSCTSANTHSFSVTGTNISAYLASSDQYFTGASWNEQTISSTTTLTATFPESATTGYFLFRNSEGQFGLSHSASLANWSDTCTDNYPEDTDTDENLDTEENNDNNSESNVNTVPGVNPGDVIVSSTSSAVYYVTETYGRRVFINEATYFTWFDSFERVKTVSADTLTALPLEGSMLPKAGVVLVKIQSSPSVYFLETAGDELVPVLREIDSESDAINWFGSYWSDYVIDVEPTFFTKFTLGSELEGNEDLNVELGNMKKRVDLHE